MKVRSWSSETPSSINSPRQQPCIRGLHGLLSILRDEALHRIQAQSLTCQSIRRRLGAERNRFAHVYNRGLASPARQQLYTCRQSETRLCSKDIALLL